MIQLVQAIVSVLLYFIIFFGISFILNMLLRKTWLMTFVYPFIVFLIIGNSSITQYFVNAGEAFPKAFSNITGMTIMDIVILGSGLVGTIVSGLVIRALRKSGYQMF